MKVYVGLFDVDKHAVNAVGDCADCQVELHRQPILADEVQTFKALITVHKVLQEGHPIAVRDAQANVNWLESLTRGVTGEGLRGKKQLSLGACECLLDHCYEQSSTGLTITQDMDHCCATTSIF